MQLITHFYTRKSKSIIKLVLSLRLLQNIYRSCATFLPSFEEMNFPTRQNHNVKPKSYQHLLHLCKDASLRQRLYDVFSQLHYARLDLSRNTKIPA